LSFKIKYDIPLLLWPRTFKNAKSDITDSIKLFYEKNPFPNYSNLDSKRSLIQKAEQGLIASLLNKQIPNKAKILDVGCGTGQLSNYLGLKSGRRVFATDISFNSLKLGQKYKEKNRIDNVSFLQMNLFAPVFKPESFDLVICYGVLHHTKDPFLGFQIITKLLKRGGFIILGLYNAYGRIPNNVKKVIFKITGNRGLLMDPVLSNKKLSKFKKHIWLMDQFKNPYESTHTIGQVLHWFDKCDIEFVNSFPKFKAFKSVYTEEQLLIPNPRGGAFDHLIVQLNLLKKGYKDSGFFVTIGRRRS
jgi:2-polyprenyl-3-methyl-5-hydroxy-6-metoxy-1,4-benzoquinol methylase